MIFAIGASSNWLARNSGTFPLTGHEGIKVSGGNTDGIRHMDVGQLPLGSELVDGGRRHAQAARHGAHGEQVALATLDHS
jgi:hypothetical protein